SREDRNSFVRILTGNIQNDKRDNFDQHISDGVDVAAYDYRSIMHYPATAFGRLDSTGNALTTIEVLTPDITIGQRSGLSPADISGVNSLYAAEDCTFFNPDRLSISAVGGGKWRLDERLQDGRTHNIAIVGDNRVEGEQALALARTHRFDQICFVGRPDASMTYFLSDGNAPSGAQAGEDCLSINPAGSSIVNDRGWKIIEDTAAGRRSISTFPNAGEAYKSLDIWRQRGFRYQCFVGRPQAALTYYRR
ncbi:MAG: M12 family metallopeptidase, partial [Hyphomonadaceae bacterium]